MFGGIIMELSLMLMENIASLFIMMAIGYSLVKTKICKVEDSRILSSILLYVAAPCSIVKAFQITLTSDKIKGLLLCIIAAVIIHIIFIGGTTILSKRIELESVERASIIYSNSGNLIIPLVTVVLGSDMVFYTCGYMIIQTILMWTHCKFIISQQRTFNIKKIVFNINVISIVVGLFLFLAQIKLPTIIISSISSMSNLLGPLSMMIVGMLLSQIKFVEIFNKRKHYIIAMIRLIVLPGIVLLFFVVSRIGNLVDNGNNILLISLLASSAPSASTVTQFAQIYDNQAEKTSSINALTTMLCIFTMPLIVMIYMALI